MKIPNVTLVQQCEIKYALSHNFFSNLENFILVKYRPLKLSPLLETIIVTLERKKEPDMLTKNPRPQLLHIEKV